MQSTFHNDAMELTIAHNSAWLHLTDAEPVLVITTVTKIEWRDVERSVSLAVETNVFDANLGIEYIAEKILSDLIYAIG